MTYSRYRLIFAAEYGYGPWPCVFCKEPTRITDRYFVVHHVNHNHDDNRIDNLAPAHLRCHARHHGQVTMASLSAEERSDRAGRAGKFPKRKRRYSKEGLEIARQVAVENLSRSKTWSCNECGLMSRAGALGRHQAVSEHKGRSLVEGGV